MQYGGQFSSARNGSAGGEETSEWLAYLPGLQEKEEPNAHEGEMAEGPPLSGRKLLTHPADTRKTESDESQVLFYSLCPPKDFCFQTHLQNPQGSQKGTTLLI